MPAVGQWESYFDAAGILESLCCRCLTGDAVEFGNGYGTFTVAAARHGTGAWCCRSSDVSDPLGPHQARVLTG